MRRLGKPGLSLLDLAIALPAFSSSRNPLALRRPLKPEIAFVRHPQRNARRRRRPPRQLLAPGLLPVGAGQPRHADREAGRRSRLACITTWSAISSARRAGKPDATNGRSISRSSRTTSVTARCGMRDGSSRGRDSYRIAAMREGARKRPRRAWGAWGPAPWHQDVRPRTEVRPHSHIPSREADRRYGVIA